MLPILKYGEKSINESLDIIKMIDHKGEIDRTNYEKYINFINKALVNIGQKVHSLAMPYWIYTPEFDDVSRTYFQGKKELKKRRL